MLFSYFTPLDTTLLMIVISLLVISLFLSKIIEEDKTATISSKKLIIGIEQNGDILFNNKVIEKRFLLEELSNYDKDTYICISCNKKTQFEIFTQLLKTLQSNNFKHLGITPSKI